VRGVHLTGIGIVTAWGEGLAALPADARQAAAGRRVIAMARPAIAGERFRRATRECLMGVAAVRALLHATGLDPAGLAGDGTTLVFVTAAAYGAANREFVAPATSAAALHFPYTAPSAVPAEVAIEFGMRGGYVILVGGPVTTIDALWQAGRAVARGECARALVLAVESFADCADLYARARFRLPRPLVEAAACALLVPGEDEVRVGAPRRSHERGPSAFEAEASRRAGETFACGPLIALALARQAQSDGALTGEWRGRRGVFAIQAPASPAQSKRGGGARASALATAARGTTPRAEDI
jgi:hypothetical protein